MINRDDLINELQEEQRLRKVLRSLLKEFIKNKDQQKIQEEDRFRHIIRSLIGESLAADVAAEQPQESTGINALRRLLKNIIPTIEEAYKELTTSPEQRASFRAHILNAVDNSLRPATVNLIASEEEEEEDLEEKVDLEIGVEEDKFIPARPQDEEEEETTQEETEDSFEEIEDMNTTGRNFASTTFNKVEKQILDAYEDIYADQQDREEFRDYLLTNLKLYFDRFEDELKPDVAEPLSPDYSPQKDQQVDDAELGF
ncbi:MAG: hypothetical protein GOVbin630_120 [Prokaryotic dsDNA virus sp.]|nr:MAG: hypothetical protein GOVbin630_120 [Prokaryotic dsDNA virus sp.]|tara:strand:- start:16467 stop:17237 length:771 start_codon:yes stop_codon:yes gene_type:complete